MTLLTLTPSKTKRSARRCLFGRPDPVKTSQWLDDQLSEIRREQESKWGFDFVAESVLPSSSSDYVFTAIDSATVPQFYRLKYVPSATAHPLARAAEERSPSPLPVTSSAESESDTSMDCTSLSSPPTPRKRGSATPKRPLGQTKVTDYMRVKKRLRRSPKTDDLRASTSENASDAASPSPLRS